MNGDAFLVVHAECGCGAKQHDFVKFTSRTLERMDDGTEVLVLSDSAGPLLNVRLTVVRPSEFDIRFWDGT